MPLFSGSTSPIGLDISDLSLKLVQLKKSGNKIKIQALGKIDLEPGLLSNGEILKQKDLAKQIKKLIAHPDFGKVTSAEAAICLPEGKTFLKIVEIDKQNQDKTKAIKDELEKHIPIPLEELFFDWQIIGDSGHSHLVLIGAAPQKLVNDHLQVLREAHLSGSVVETEPVSVCRCLLEAESPANRSLNQENTAIVDIGATDASLTFYSKNTILFSVNLPISGEAITEKIAAALDIDHERAEKIKILYGQDDNAQETAAKKIIDNLAGELKDKCAEALVFFNHHFSAWGPVKKIILCGGGANIKDLDKIIQKATGIPTMRGDVFINFRGNKKNFSSAFRRTFGLNTDFLAEEKKTESKAKESKTVKISHDISLCYATAIGLALRGILLDE
ncbi:MAG TPA: type IV pilus assembly protein PilM [Candidatus Nanoarchaeia archaeon]|nr:type IV pilus assembly protein PilM [Candidatus Nanoarchaeia archaeon]